MNPDQELRQRIDDLCERLNGILGLMEGDPRAAETVRVCREQISQLVDEQTRELASMSMTDELTGLLNRRGFLFRAEQELARAQRTGQWLAMLFADLDGLKALNDALGHPAGDAALQGVAQVLRETFRGGDLLARLGGDEFVALARFHRGGRFERAITRRLRSALRRRNAAGDPERPLRLSFGLLLVGTGAGAEASPEEGLEDLLARADQIMYSHKHRRRK